MRTKKPCVSVVLVSEMGESEITHQVALVVLLLSVFLAAKLSRRRCKCDF